MDPGDVDTRLREFFADKGDYAAVYLFGSQARNEARRDSDVDIGLLYKSPPSATLGAQPFGLEADLSTLLGRPVQCVVLNKAPPDLVHRVLRDGRLLAENDRGRRIEFEVKLRNEYFDILPTLLMYRRLARA